MSEQSPFELIAERVERLLLRHEEVRRTNALLLEQVAAITRERDAMRSRLIAARGRIDALIERLPTDVDADTDTDTASSQPTHRPQQRDAP